MKLSRLILFLVLALPLASACDGIKREDPEKLDPETATRHGVNYFAANCMSLYYLWSEEIDGELTRWLRQDINADPIEKVRQIRYKKDGKDYDRWTEVTDSYEEMSSSVEGVSTTYGCDIVLQAMDEPVIRNFMQKTLYDEVIPTLSLPKDDLTAFAEAVTGRFANPFIKHQLLSICLNCVSKWRARCMPSLLGYVEKTGKLPEHLTFSLAAMMSLYRGGTLGEDGKLHCMRDGAPYELQDAPAVLTFFARTSGMTPEAQAQAFLSNEAFFGQDLTAIPGLKDSVAASLADILNRGMKAVVQERFPL